MSRLMIFQVVIMVIKVINVIKTIHVVEPPKVLNVIKALEFNHWHYGKVIKIIDCTKATNAY